MTPEFDGAAAVIPWIGARRRLPRRLSADVDRPEHHQVDAVLSGGHGRGGGDQRRGNLLLVPRYGALGAAWTNAAAYGVHGEHRVRAVAAGLSDPARVGPARADRRRRRVRLPGGVGPASDGAAGRRRWRADRRHHRVSRVPAALGFFDGRELRTLGRMLARARAGRRRAGAGGRRQPTSRSPTISRSHEPQRDAGRGSRLLVAILALAEWLRATGLSFGLPAVYNPDEIAIMSRALGFAKGDLNPHNFLYPTFYFYVLFAWVGASFACSWLTGAVPSLGGVPDAVLHRSLRHLSRRPHARRGLRRGDGVAHLARRAPRPAGGPARAPRCSSRSRRPPSATRTT